MANVAIPPGSSKIERIYVGGENQYGCHDGMEVSHNQAGCL